MTPLLDIALRSSVLLLAGLGVAALFRRRSAALRHFVLVSAVVAVAALPALMWAVPSWHPPLARIAESPAPAAGDAEPIVAPSSESSADGTMSSATPFPLFVAFLTWGAGFAIGAVRLAASFVRLGRLTSRAVPVRDGRWARTAHAIAQASGLRRTFILSQTETPDMLATWGALRPQILLPVQAHEWSDDRIYAVLCHELAHVRRHDWLVQVGAEIVRVVYWFNPLMWIACLDLRRESERACDDAVLNLGVPAREYAAHLLDVARSCRPASPAVASAMPMARPSTLEGRIAAMLNHATDRRPLSRPAVLVTALALLAVTLPTAAFRAAQDEPLPLAGSVYDMSGAVLPDVRLTLEGAHQGKVEAITDAAGRFEFSPIPPGRYLLEASLSGFRSLHQEFELRRARDWDRDITLQVGDVQEAIIVSEQRVTKPPGGSQAKGPAPVRVGGNIRPPRKLVDVRPIYPPAMRDAGIEGVVSMEAVIGRDGTVITVRVLSAGVHPELAQAAVDAVRQWRFDATLLNGEPIDVLMTTVVHFKLSD